MGPSLKTFQYLKLENCPRSPREYIKIQKNVPELSPETLQERGLGKSPKEVVGEPRENGVPEAKARKYFKRK